MKVRILTCHFSVNVGSLLQAYSLRRWLQRRGHDASFVPYHPAYMEEGVFDRLWDPRKLGRNTLAAYFKLAAIHRRHFANRAWLEELRAFRREQLGVTGPEAGTAAELQHCDPGDLLICGSDALWWPPPQSGGLDPVYFLAFPGADRARRRISYAMSFHRSSLAPELHAEVAALLAPLDAISVRERSGARIVSEVAGRDAVVTPDPTILHGDFSALLPDRAGSEGHVFCYAIRSTGVIREVAGEVSAIVRVPILSPRNPFAPWRTVGKAIDAGPFKWLQLLVTSRIAVLNSFHGVAMSILLHRPFIAVGLPGAHVPYGDRYIDLMAQTGLSDRLVVQPDPANVRRLVEQPIDWDAVDAKLAELRSAGTAFLDAQLKLAEPGAQRRAVG